MSGAVLSKYGAICSCIMFGASRPPYLYFKGKCLKKSVRVRIRVRVNNMFFLFNFSKVIKIARKIIFNYLKVLYVELQSAVIYWHLFWGDSFSDTRFQPWNACKPCTRWTKSKHTGRVLTSTAALCFHRGPNSPSFRLLQRWSKISNWGSLHPRLAAANSLSSACKYLNPGTSAGSLRTSQNTHFFVWNTRRSHKTQIKSSADAEHKRTPLGWHSRSSQQF